MNDWSLYTFIYKDSQGHFHECKNPRFVAEHKCCYAIKTKDILDEFEYVNDLIYSINDYELSKQIKSFMNVQGML